MDYCSAQFYCTKSGVHAATGTVAYTRAMLAKAALFCTDEANMRRWQASHILPMYARCFRRNRSPPRECPRDTLPAPPESVRVGHILS